MTCTCAEMKPCMLKLKGWSTSSNIKDSQTKHGKSKPDSVHHDIKLKSLL